MNQAKYLIIVAIKPIYFPLSGLYSKISPLIHQSQSS